MPANATKHTEQFSNPKYLLEPPDLLLQFGLPGPVVVFLDAYAAASASALFRLQLEELQVLQLFPEVLNQLQGKQEEEWLRVPLNPLVLCTIRSAEAKGRLRANRRS